jgi:uncharacterized membrane protein
VRVRVVLIPVLRRLLLIAIHPLIVFGVFTNDDDDDDDVTTILFPAVLFLLLFPPTNDSINDEIKDDD